MDIRYTGDKPEKEAAQVFNETMRALFAEDDRVVYLDADLMGSLKTQNLWKEFPDRVFNCGIQEANMVGVACGLYLAGYKPYIHTFSPFASRRVFDQVFLSVGYANKSVRIIGSDAGIMATYNGGTHMCLEDVAMMRTVPRSCVVDVTDATMLAAMLRLTKDLPGLTYIRTARRGLPDVYSADETFELGKGKVLAEGGDVTIVAAGIMVSTALQAAARLSEHGVSARVVDPVTIKPLDGELMLRCARETGAIVAAENHSVIGGLGSAVSDVVSESCPVPVFRIGVKDSFGQVGNEAYLRDQYHLTVQDLVSLAMRAVESKNG